MWPSSFRRTWTIMLQAHPYVTIFCVTFYFVFQNPCVRHVNFTTQISLPSDGWIFGILLTTTQFFLQHIYHYHHHHSVIDSNSYVTQLSLQGYFSVGFGMDDMAGTFKEVARIPDKGEPSLHLYAVNVTLPSRGAHPNHILQVPALSISKLTE